MSLVSSPATVPETTETTVAFHRQQRFRNSHLRGSLVRQSYRSAVQMPKLSLALKHTGERPEKSAVGPFNYHIWAFSRCPFLAESASSTK